MCHMESSFVSHKRRLERLKNRLPHRPGRISSSSSPTNDSMVGQKYELDTCSVVAQIPSPRTWKMLKQYTPKSLLLEKGTCFRSRLLSSRDHAYSLLRPILLLIVSCVCNASLHVRKHVELCETGDRRGSACFVDE